ncbi:hypothetical protein [Pseudarthrobacter sp. DSP2-3-2b1]|uniref:hypothetical protein n=1 Tax=Pseudarthrobacter sp. DSP2-3-2b1 TaxID=2804661 RepID=UPI003CF6BE7B
MSTQSASSSGILRGVTTLRSAFVWLLLTLVLTGAASYTHGSRYQLVPGHSQYQSTGERCVEEVPAPAESAPAPDEVPAPVSQAVSAVHEVGPSIEPVALEQDSERRHAPRGEPAPVRTSAVDPPSLTHRLPGDWMLSSAVPPEPDLPGLTAVELSISRT